MVTMERVLIGRSDRRAVSASLPAAEAAISHSPPSPLRQRNFFPLQTAFDYKSVVFGQSCTELHRFHKMKITELFDS